MERDGHRGSSEKKELRAEQVRQSGDGWWNEGNWLGPIGKEEMLEERNAGSSVSKKCGVVCWWGSR